MSEKNVNISNLNGSQISRENIKQNTKILKSEINEVDAEIQAL